MDRLDLCAEEVGECHYCSQGLDKGLCGLSYNKFSESTQKWAILIQNGECGDNACRSHYYRAGVIDRYDFNIIVLNVGEDSVEEENDCVASHKSMYLSSFDGYEGALGETTEDICAS